MIFNKIFTQLNTHKNLIKASAKKNFKTIIKQTKCIFTSKKYYTKPIIIEAVLFMPLFFFSVEFVCGFENVHKL